MHTRRRLLAATVGGMVVTTLSGCANSGFDRTTESRTYCLQTARLRRTVCTPQRIPSAAAESEAKRFLPTSDRLTLFIVRGARLEAITPLDIEVDDTARIGTLPRSLIRLQLTPGQHIVSFTWGGREHRFTVAGAAGEVQVIELAGSAVPLAEGYHWSNADPAGAMEHGCRSTLGADVRL